MAEIQLKHTQLLNIHKHTVISNRNKRTAAYSVKSHTTIQK